MRTIWSTVAAATLFVGVAVTGAHASLPTASNASDHTPRTGPVMNGAIELAQVRLKRRGFAGRRIGGRRYGIRRGYCRGLRRRGVGIGFGIGIGIGRGIYGPGYYRRGLYGRPYYGRRYRRPFYGRRIYRAPVVRSRYSARHHAWCDRRYRSYRRSDGTFQPYRGGRRRCNSPFDGR